MDKDTITTIRLILRDIADDADFIQQDVPLDMRSVSPRFIRAYDIEKAANEIMRILDEVELGQRSL